MHNDELLAVVIDALSELKARDVVILDVGELTAITSHMLIVSGTSSRHVRAIADSVIEKAKRAGAVLIGVEGHEFGEWVLVDLADVVVHIMQPRTREFYKLENLWNMEARPGASAGPTLAEPGR